MWTGSIEQALGLRATRGDEMASSATGSFLTARESEVLGWIQAGKNNWEISQILHISERTVKFHVANLCRKLGANTRAHAVAIGLQRGLLTMN